MSIAENQTLFPRQPKGKSGHKLEGARMDIRATKSLMRLQQERANCRESAIDLTRSPPNN